MKKITITMLSLFLLLGYSNSAVSQERKNTGNLEEKQYLEKQEKHLQLINDRRFIIEADMVYDKQLNTYVVSSTTNFVKVDKDDILIQLTFKETPNWNGIGGVTIEGEIAEYEIKNKNTDGPITVVAKIASINLGMSTVKITVFDDGMARAVLSGTFGSRVTVSGNFRVPDESAVFKGVSKY